MSEEREYQAGYDNGLLHDSIQSNAHRNENEYHANNTQEQRAPLVAAYWAGYREGMLEEDAQLCQRDGCSDSEEYLTGTDDGYELCEKCYAYETFQCEGTCERIFHARNNLNDDDICEYCAGRSQS